MPDLRQNYVENTLGVIKSRSMKHFVKLFIETEKILNLKLYLFVNFFFRVHDISSKTISLIRRFVANDDWSMRIRVEHDVWSKKKKEVRYDILSKWSTRFFFLQTVLTISYPNSEATGRKIVEPRCEKTGLRGFRPGPTQTGLCSHRRWLEA